MSRYLKMLVCFRVDASMRIGTGHVMRCLTLANAIRERGGECFFIHRVQLGSLEEIIRTQGFSVVLLQEVVSAGRSLDANYSGWLGVSQKQDVEDTIIALGDRVPDWLVVDHYSIDGYWESKIDPYVGKLIAIDDLGNRGHVCDVLLDQNLGADAGKYEGCIQSNSIVLAGSKYALLRTEFKEWRKTSIARRGACDRLENILVTLGGADMDNYTGKVLSVLGEAGLPKSTSVTVVMGPSSSHLELIKQQAERLSLNVSVLVNVSNMAELMSMSDLAIGAAGSTSWERCCLGLPTIQLVIAENQRLIAESLLQANAVKVVDEVSEIAAVVRSALEWMHYVSQASLAVIDGKGVQRVIELMFNEPRLK